MRTIAYEDSEFNKEDVLGKGTLGKCIKTKLAHLYVCIKILRKGLVLHFPLRLHYYPTVVIQICQGCMALYTNLQLLSLHTVDNLSIQHSVVIPSHRQLMSGRK